MRDTQEYAWQALRMQAQRPRWRARLARRLQRPRIALSQWFRRWLHRTGLDL